MSVCLSVYLCLHIHLFFCLCLLDKFKECTVFLKGCPVQGHHFGFSVGGEIQTWPGSGLKLNIITDTNTYTLIK